MRFLDYYKKLNELTTLGTEEVDEHQIDMAYNKAKYSVKLVQLYDQMTNQKLLTNISTIATLNQGVYGLYNSVENKKVIGNNVANKVKMKFGQDVMQNHKIDQVPNVVIKQYIPDVDLKQIQPSDVIHVNVQKHLQTHGDSKETIIELASTIVHECTHELELQTTGKTSEVGPVNAERRFKDWVQKNWTTIVSKIPELGRM
jgi:hypothetical protein